MLPLLLRRVDHAVVTRAEELAKLITEFPVCHAHPAKGLVMANPVFIADGESKHQGVALNPSDTDVLKAIQSGMLVSVLRGESCVFSTPETINDDMRPTDHNELLERGLYPLVRTLGASYIQPELERALRDMCTDALGVFCAHQCFYVEMVKEREGRSPLSLDRGWLPNYLAASFLRESSALRSLEIRTGDLAKDRSYKVSLSGMRILARDYGVDWGVALPAP